MASSPPEVPGLKASKRIRTGQSPLTPWDRGQAARVPGRCLLHTPLVSSLAQNVFPFLAAPSLGAQSLLKPHWSL